MIKIYKLSNFVPEWQSRLYGKVMQVYLVCAIIAALAVPLYSTKEDNCSVQWIPNGEIQELVLETSFNYWRFRYEGKTVNKLVPVGATPSSNATLFLSCHVGYTIKGKGISRTQVSCSEGRWSPDPVCLRKDCSDLRIRNGDIEEHISLHRLNSSRWRFRTRIVKLQNFTETNSSRNATLFLNCHLGYTFQGKGIRRTPITCSEGRLLPDPVCLRTETNFTLPWFIRPPPRHVVEENQSDKNFFSPWIRRSTRPTTTSYTTRHIAEEKQNDCPVQWVPNGEIKEQVLGPKQWNYKTLSYERTTQNVKLSPGTPPSRNATLFLFCHVGYTFQGKGIARTPIMCSEGRWSPEPVCLKYSTRKVSTTRKHTTEEKITTTSSTKITQSFPNKPEVKKEQSTLQIVKNTTEEECFCKYSLNDDNVVAYADGDILKMHDRVKNGTVVKFRCKQIGFQHLVGQEKLVCNGCQSWHKSDFPTCINPKQGNAVILYDDKMNVSIQGVLEVRKGQNVRLSCIAVEEAQYPKWTVPDERKINVVHKRMERPNDFLYVSQLDILSPTQGSEGNYSCAVEKYPPTTLKLRVIEDEVACPEIEDEKGISIRYGDWKRSVNSTVFIFCRRLEQRLIGKNELICLSNGEWSDKVPECVEDEVACPEIEDEKGISIRYGDWKRSVNSTVFIFCRRLEQRLIGKNELICLSNGEWSDKVPECVAPGCTYENLMWSSPKDLIPDMVDVSEELQPVGTELRLLCEGNLILIGRNKATCGPNSKWDFGDAQCVIGCYINIRNVTSPLIIKPMKEHYRFGEIAVLRCPVGHRLTTDVQMIMCIGHSWSDPLPECEEIEDEETK